MRKFLKNGDVSSPDYKWTGEEPVWKPSDEEGDDLKKKKEDFLIRGFNFYNYYLERKDFFPIIKEFMESRPCYKQNHIDLIQKWDTSISPVVVGAMARMASRGCPIVNKTCDMLDSMLRKIELKNHAVGDGVDKVDNTEMIMKSRISKTLIVVDEIVDSMTDDTTTRPKDIESIKGTLDQYELDEASRDIINNYIQKYIDAYLDDDQKEGFSYLTRKGIQNRVGILEDMKSEVSTWKKETKARKPRAKKTMTAEKQVRNLNFRQSWAVEKLHANKPSETLFLAESVNPTSIPMSHHLYVFNVKYRTLSVYHSSGTQGFEVKGSTLKRFDDKTSYTVTLRKPEQILNEVSRRTPKQIEKTLSNLTTKRKEANGRINGNCILFRVIDNKRPL